MEGYAAVLSSDGQGGALLREVAKLGKFEDIEILVRSYWDVQQLSAAVAASLITSTRGEVATVERRILSVSPGDGLQSWHAMLQAQISGGIGCVDGEAHIAKAHQERE